ncbi:spore germination protein KC [Halobacillus karajensis]|uniref:Ger(x)C family spore germination protein n=1 Tax=Halobacillus karajensis TaxID=195088 RepID=UPI0008A73222|nr:Ger(x)C family spore germination protein [Halobacillus karajensis]SEI04235.1 spore germination protein KC [Halobacillus karajensis]
MRQRIGFIWLFLVLILLTGCWDQNELEDVALVMGMGIDKTEDGLYDVSFQIVNPEQVSGGEMSQSSKGTAVTTYRDKGQTLFETIRKISKEVPRKLSFSHMVVLIIGESLAEDEGLFEVMDFTERFYGFRSTATVLISRGSPAQSILSILNPIEKIPAMKIQEASKKTAEVWGETPDQNINDLIQTLTTKSKEVSLSGIALVGDMQEGQHSSINEQAAPSTYIEINGLAIFQDGKLKGWLEDKEARGVSWVRNNIQKTVVTSTCKENEGILAVEVRNVNTKLKPTIKKGEPKITVNIKSEGSLQEVTCPVDLTDPNVIIELNKKLAKAIEEEVNTSVKTLQEEETDVFGFGETLNQKHPKEWKKMKEDWSSTFSEMDVEVNVEFFIRGTGLRTKPLILEKK